MKDTLKIVEGSLSVFAYHLSEDGCSGHKALCGRHDVMSTLLPLRVWNSAPDHLHSRYCKKCTEIAHEHGLALPAGSQQALVF